MCLKEKKSKMRLPHNYSSTYLFPYYPAEVLNYFIYILNVNYFLALCSSIFLGGEVLDVSIVNL